MEISQIPEVAFTGDTCGTLFDDPNLPLDVYQAALLIMAVLESRLPSLHPHPHSHPKHQIPEVAFTGDTCGALFEDPNLPPDVYRAKLLIVELTFVDETVSWEQVGGGALLLLFWDS